MAPSLGAEEGSVTTAPIYAEVDGIVPLAEGGDPYRLEGLQGICSPCHWRKTGAENTRGVGRDAA